MKAVHSYWFAPFSHTQGSRFTGGFPAARFFWYSWVLSFFTAKRNFKNIELVTDDHGSKLVKELGLEYQAIRTDFNALPLEHQDFWNLGKFHAYLLQEEPFIHLDSDVFLWKNLPAELVSSRMFGQSYETTTFNRKFYGVQVEAMKKHLNNLPQGLWDNDTWAPEFRALNCGIFGGTDIELIHHYSKICIEIITCPENVAGWATIGNTRTELLSLSNCNAAVEQIPNVLMCEKLGFEPSVLFTGDPRDLDKKGELGYTHLLADAKRSPEYLRPIEQRMVRDFPSFKNRIDDLFDS